MISATTIRSVEEEKIVLPPAQIARYLQSNLGQKITAYVAGLKDQKIVGRWIAGKSVPGSTETDMRLRCAYEVTRLIVDAYGPETARAWMFGSNSRLDDEAPAYIIRHAETPDDLRHLVPVARAFAGAAF